MDNNKIISLSEISPFVNIANYFSLGYGVNQWGPRNLADYELILIREGRYCYEEEGMSPVDLTHFDLLIIPPFHRHTLTLSGYSKKKPAIACIHNHPYPAWGYEGVAFDISPGVRRKTTLSGGDFAEADHIFSRAAFLFKENHLYQKEMLSSLCRQIWLMAGAYWNLADPISSADRRMENMLKYIRNNVFKTITRSDLALEFNLTPEYINALFKKELGISPTGVINREKVLRGYIMLHNEGLSVKETAYRCGFKDEYYFSRLFKKFFAISPGAVKGGKRAQ